MAKNVLDIMRSKAEALATVRTQIRELEEKQQEAMSPLKAQRDELQNALLEDLRKYDLKTVKSTSGESFTRMVRKSIGVMDPRKALDWATKNGCIAIDKVRTAAHLRNAKALPDGFDFVETDYISIRSPKSASGNEQGA